MQSVAVGWPAEMGNPTEKMGRTSKIVSERHSLALDALSRIAAHFAKKPDVHDLMEQVALTMAGQFGVGSAFATIIHEQRARGLRPYAGTGQFQAHSQLMSLSLSEEDSTMLLSAGGTLRVNEIDLAGTSAQLGLHLMAAGVSTVAPLTHEHELLGLIGLGNKVTGAALTDSELELLGGVVRTLTPFVAHSDQFSRITANNIWYSEILDSFGQACLVFDGNGHLCKINQPAWLIIKALNPGAEKKDFLTGRCLKQVFPESVLPGWSAFAERCRTLTQSVRQQTMIARHESTERHFSIRASRISSKDGQGSDTIITLDDVTERKRRERNLYELQKLADTGSMIASITHELNNFLALVMGGVEMAEIAHTKGQNEKVKSSLLRAKKVLRSVRRFAAGLTDQSRRSGEKRPVNINNLIDHILTFVKVQKRFRTIQISTELDAKLGKQPMVADQISQLLLNFVYNAADAVAQAKRQFGTISITTFAKQDSVDLVIADNGVGIEDKVKNKLFRTPVTTKPDGHGFGLTTCAHILKEHGATVDIVSKTGQGTSFHISFPTDNSEPDNQATSPIVVSNYR